ncbi:LptF/LptG family permease [Pelagibacterium limicola]|uniref:LptF/LptG family permease n=1 Tax=Pelagibacterium limicola TaxID=2791022 RepID=UPI0018AFE152|nr:LptF/LptG family permease [Pelagibacterium limicola]
MDRLSRYLLTQFLAQALTIFAAGGVLIWLMQLLRLFDLVAAKGQNFLTLMGQSALTTPTFARSILYVCFAIGLVRGLRALHQSRELHTIHAAQRTPALWGAVFAFTLIGATAVTLVANWIEPHSRRIAADWSAEIAADVVGRALVPGRFSEIEQGLVFSISGRHPDGTLIDFFFDDSTNTDTRRTYFADTASVFQDDDGYQLILNDGAIQYENRVRGGLSQIRFVQYHISLASLIDAGSPNRGIDQADTLDLMERIAAEEIRNPEAAIATIHGRLADTLRALALCAFVAALCAFPDGKRAAKRLPLELVVLLVAFAEQAVSAFSGGGANHYISPALILFASLLLLWRKASRASLPWSGWRRAQ